MLFSWLKNARRRRQRERGLPDHLLPYVRDHLWQYERLSSDQQKKLLSDAAVLLAEKNWEGCGGLAMNDQVRLAIALQTALVTLGLGEEYFDSVLSVLVYPDEYHMPEKLHLPGGIVVERSSARLGESWHRGPVILSYTDVQQAGESPNQGRSIVAHEFAHQLDMHNGGSADGVPAMRDNQQTQRWLSATQHALQQLQHDCQQDADPMLDCYGGTHPSELFAVASEAFFQTPQQIAWRDRRLYDALVEFYRVEPLKWVR